MSIDPLFQAIGFRIEAERKRQHITPSALAQKTQLPIGRYELGLEAISLPALYAIARVLHCKVAQLLPESEE